MKHLSRAHSTCHPLLSTRATGFEPAVENMIKARSTRCGKMQKVIGQAGDRTQDFTHAWIR